MLRGVRSDEELMAAYVAGDMAAFDELFRRLAPGLTRVLSRDLRRKEEAHDLVQQTFLQLHRHRLDYEPGRPLRPWLYTIALNLKRQYFRYERRRPTEPLPEANELAAGSRAAVASGLDPRGSGTGSASSGHARVEARQAIELALRQLPPDQADVIALHWLADVPLPEVAQIVGASLSAVKVRAHRGYKTMRATLGTAFSGAAASGRGRGASGEPEAVTAEPPGGYSGGKS